MATVIPEKEISLDNYEFGGKLARRLGADMSEDQECGRQDPEREQREEKMRTAARANARDWKAHLAKMDFEERVGATLECLGRKNNQKEILYDLLVYCQTEHTEEETEKFLEQHKEFYNGYHTANKYLFFFRRTGAIEEIEYDSDGVRITEDMRNELRELGANEDEVAEIAVDWHYKTTDVGDEAIRRFNPVDRTFEMLATQADSRIASYQRLLNFCKQPRSLKEITDFMDGDPGLEVDPRTGVMQMQPSAYIGKLDSAGALTWEDGWKTTPGGMEVLESLPLEETSAVTNE